MIIDVTSVYVKKYTINTYVYFVSNMVCNKKSLT
jgi:hypothetical protein